MIEITTGDVAWLFDTTPKTIAELAKREIIMSAGKRGRWQLEPSVGGYVRHLREVAAGRGGNDGGQVRARLGAAQADLAEAKVVQLQPKLSAAAARAAGVVGRKVGCAFQPWRMTLGCYARLANGYLETYESVHSCSCRGGDDHRWHVRPRSAGR